jgi:tripartite-type tricarboxylate transporter receptor subunit TctC
MRQFCMAAVSRRAMMAGGLALAGRGAAAQERFPARPIQVVVPFAPGGSGDAATRLIQAGVSELLGQPLVIINRPGAGTNIGMQAVARARPDGYTLLMAATGLTINKVLFDNLAFDPMTELTAVSNVFNSPIFLAIHPSVPATNLAELLAYIRARPGAVNYGSSGVGTSSHIGGELFKQVTGTDMLHIPFSGGGAAIAGAASASGLQLIFSNVVTLAGAIRGGALRAIAIAADRRSPQMPEVPTFVEQGVDFRFGSWFGLCAPAATPRPVIETLSGAVQSVLRRPEVIRLAQDQGGEPIGDTPEQFARFLAEDAARLQALVRSAGIRPQ